MTRTPANDDKATKGYDVSTPTGRRIQAFVEGGWYDVEDFACEVATALKHVADFNSNSFTVTDEEVKAFRKAFMTHFLKELDEC